MGVLVCKYKTGGLFLMITNDIVKITNINKFLVKNSQMNKAITVEFLNTNMEMNFSYLDMEQWAIKYLGRNEKVAQILYSSSRKENPNGKAYANLYDLKSLAQRYHRQDD